MRPRHKPDDSTPSGTTPRARSIRLVFSYRGSDIELVSQQRVSMVPFPPHALVPRQDERGSWLVLADAEGRPLYRRVIANPIAQDMEVVSDDPDHPLARITVEEPEGTFFVVVPDIAAARSIAFFGHPEDSDAKSTAVRELRRFDLHADSKEGR